MSEKVWYDDCLAGECEILVVIVVYRVVDLTIDCLRSLSPEVSTVPGTRVVIVENGSGGDSADRLRNCIEEQGWADWASLEVISPNRGFAGGNNFILRQVVDAPVHPRYVLLLNADTVVHPGCLKHCHSVMEGDDTIGAMSCRFENTDGSMQNVARKFPTPPRAIAGALGLPWMFPSVFGWADTEDPGWNRDTVARDVDWLGGAFLLVQTDLLVEIGILDEDFVFYGEDIEFCHRIWTSGRRCFYDPTTSITHHGGASNDEIFWSDDVRGRHTWRSRYLVQRKCFGWLAMSCLRLVDIFVWSLKLIGRSLSQPWSSTSHATARTTLKTLLGPLSTPDSPDPGASES